MTRWFVNVDFDVQMDFTGNFCTPRMRRLKVAKALAGGGGVPFPTTITVKVSSFDLLVKVRSGFMRAAEMIFP